jgi:hypothetical protein
MTRSAGRVRRDEDAIELRRRHVVGPVLAGRDEVVATAADTDRLRVR